MQGSKQGAFDTPHLAPCLNRKSLVAIRDIQNGWQVAQAAAMLATFRSAHLDRIAEAHGARAAE